MTIPAAPRWANNRAIASPSPWVLPVTMAYLPDREDLSAMTPSLNDITCSTDIRLRADGEWLVHRVPPPSPADHPDLGLPFSRHARSLGTPVADTGLVSRALEPWRARRSARIEYMSGRPGLPYSRPTHLPRQRVGRSGPNAPSQSFRG